jgi:enamine deaminase RidA (YjgF/YER057c/UK114 family)
MEPGDLRDIYVDGRGNELIAVRAGAVVHGIGLTPRSRSKSTDPETIKGQAREVLRDMTSAVSVVGGSLDNVGRVTGYMRSAGKDRELVYECWEEVFADANDRPAFKVLDADLPDGTLIRLDFLAVLDQCRTRFDIPGVDARDPTVRIGSWVFTSRLHGTSPATGKTVKGLRDQAIQALENGLRLVQLAGGSPADVTQINAFGRDLGYVPELRAVIDEKFPDVQSRPEVHNLVTFVRPELEVMLELTACLR